MAVGRFAGPEPARCRGSASLFVPLDPSPAPLARAVELSYHPSLASPARAVGASKGRIGACGVSAHPPARRIVPRASPVPRDTSRKRPAARGPRPAARDRQHHGVSWDRFSFLDSRVPLCRAGRLPALDPFGHGPPTGRGAAANLQPRLRRPRAQNSCIP